MDERVMLRVDVASDRGEGAAATSAPGDDW